MEKLIGFNYIANEKKNEIFFKESEKFYFKFEQYFSRSKNEIRYTVYVNLINNDYFIGDTVTETEKELLISNYFYFLESDKKVFHLNKILKYIRESIKNGEIDG